MVECDVRQSDATGNIADPDFVFNSLLNVKFDAVVHLAAIANIRQSLEDPYRCYLVNSFGTLNMLELAARKEVRRFVYMSSANVYGVPLRLPVDEETPFNPRVPYDYSKVVAENLVRSFLEHRGLPTVVLRSWKLFGEYDTLEAAIPRFIRSCLQGQPIPLYNGGRDTTDPYYVENFCHALDLVLTDEHAVGQAFNVGAGSELSIREIAETIRKLTNSGSKIEELPPRTPEESAVMRSYPRIEKISKMLGYRPKVSFEEGLRKTIRWVKDLEAEKP